MWVALQVLESADLIARREYLSNVHAWLRYSAWCMLHCVDSHIEVDVMFASEQSNSVFEHIWESGD